MVSTEYRISPPIGIAHEEERWISSILRTMQRTSSPSSPWSIDISPTDRLIYSSENPSIPRRFCLKRYLAWHDCSHQGSLAVNVQDNKCQKEYNPTAIVLGTYIMSAWQLYCGEGTKDRRINISSTGIHSDAIHYRYLFLIMIIFAGICKSIFSSRKAPKDKKQTWLRLGILRQIFG